MKGQIDISDTFKLLYLVTITSEIRVSEIFIDPNSELVERQDPDQLSLLPDAGNMRMGINRICL